MDGAAVNVQTVRLALADLMPEYFNGWTVTLDAWLELNATKTIQIGHARTLGPDTYRSKAVDLPVTLWVNEADQAGAVSDMYEAISYDEGTSVRRLMDDERVVKADVETVGRRDEGPTGYIAADLVWRIRATNP